MTHITILPMLNDQGGPVYCAASKGKQSQGATAGQALDALTDQLAETEKGTLVIMQDWRPDQFFNGEQQHRLAELMARLRSCREEGKSLPVEDATELDALIDAELRGAAARSAAMFDGMKR